jgi:hypothetical protein
VSDKRRDIRYPARILAKVVRRGDTVELLTNDVSFRGAFLRTDAPPALRQLVRVSFALHDVVVSAHAMVVHVVPPSGGERVPGVGLQFWGPIDQQKAWDAFVHELQKRERDGVPSARATDKIRRSSERLKLTLDVELGGKVAQTRDVSETGMAIRTDAGMQIGMRIGVRLTSPSAEPLELDVVVRRRIVEPGFMGLGVEFADVTAEKHAVLLALLREHQSEADAIYIDFGDPGLH